MDSMKVLVQKHAVDVDGSEETSDQEVCWGGPSRYKFPLKREPGSGEPSVGGTSVRVEPSGKNKRRQVGEPPGW